MKVVVIDNGSHTTKVGYSGDDKPQFIIPTIVGYTKQNDELKTKTTYIGDDIKQREKFDISYPIINGRIRNWNDMERIWNYTFYNKLGIEPEEQPILLTIPEFSEDSDKERMLQTIFEVYNVPSIFISVPSILLAYSSSSGGGGMTTNSTDSIVVDCGETTTNVVSIKNGCISNATRLNFAGYELTNYMMSLVEQQDLDCLPLNREIAEDIKERLGYVVLDFRAEREKYSGITSSPSSQQKSYKLPDGKVINIGEECFGCTEALFKPALLSILSDGIHQSLYNSVMKNNQNNNDIGISKNLFNNIVLSGGTTLFPGFIDRLKKELTTLLPTDININMITSSQPQLSTWVGGSIFASHSTYNEQMWISKEEYEENGPSIVHKNYMYHHTYTQTYTNS